MHSPFYRSSAGLVGGPAGLVQPGGEIENCEMNRDTLASHARLRKGISLGNEGGGKKKK